MNDTRRAGTTHIAGTPWPMEKWRDPVAPFQYIQWPDHWRVLCAHGPGPISDHQPDERHQLCPRGLPGPGSLLCVYARALCGILGRADPRSEEHTSELQSLMRISYAVFCLKQKKTQHTNIWTT